MFGQDQQTQILTEDETLVLGACMQALQSGQPVKLSRTVTVAGQTGNLVRFDPTKQDCVLEQSGGLDQKTMLIAGAAVVVAAGGYFLYKRRGRRLF